MEIKVKTRDLQSGKNYRASDWSKDYKLFITSVEPSWGTLAITGAMREKNTKTHAWGPSWHWSDRYSPDSIWYEIIPYRNYPKEDP